MMSYRIVHALLALGLLLPAGASALPGDAAASESLGGNSAQLLKEAHAALARNDYETALAAALKVQARTPAEKFEVQQVVAHVNLARNQFTAAADALEAMHATGQGASADLQVSHRTLAQLRYQMKDFPKCEAAVLTYHKRFGYDVDLDGLLAQSQYAQNKFTESSLTIRGMLKRAEGSKHPPPEALLELWLAAEFKATNPIGVYDAMRALATNYPTDKNKRNFETLRGQTRPYE